MVNRAFVGLNGIRKSNRKLVGVEWERIDVLSIVPEAQEDISNRHAGFAVQMSFAIVFV
jgi:hypothetical protein